jgi:hypothetical protein
LKTVNANYREIRRPPKEPVDLTHRQTSSLRTFIYTLKPFLSNLRL